MRLIIHLAIAFAVPLVLTIAMTPLVIRLAHLIGAIDRPNARKAHSVATPRLGGVAVSIAFAISMIILAHDRPHPSLPGLGDRTSGTDAGHRAGGRRAPRCLG